MIEHEVERMIVRLVGDQSSYQHMLKDAATSTGHATESIGHSLKDVDRAASTTQKVIADQVRPAVDQYSEGMSQLNRQLQDGTIHQETFNRSIQNLDLARLDQLGAKFTQVGSTLAMVGGLATAAFGAMTYKAVQSAGQFEMTTVAFSTMMGSQKEAVALLEDLTDFAATTPFQMHQVEAAAQGLIMFGDRGEQLMKTLENIGNAAAATQTDFGQLTYIFNNVRGQGKLLTMQFQQLARRGVISLQDIADHYKTDIESASAMISAGKIGYEDLMGIMERLSSEGGRFAGMMEKESKAFMGLMSTLKDNIGLTFREIGQEMLPIIKPVVDNLIELTKYLRETDKFTLKLVAGTMLAVTAFGTLVTGVGSAIFVYAKYIAAKKAVLALLGSTTFAQTLSGKATMASTVALNVNTVALNGNTAGVVKNAVARGTLTTALKAQIVATVASTKAFMASAVVIKAVPYVAAAAAIAYVSRAIYRANPGIRDFNKAMEESSRLAAEISGRAQQRQTAVFDAASTMQGAEAVKYLQAELEMAEKNMQGLSAASKMSKAEADRLAPTWLSLGQAGRKVWQVQLAEYEEMRERYGEASDYVKKLRAEIELTQQTEGLGAGAKTEDIDNVKKMVAQWREQVKTMGMSEKQLIEYRMILQRIPDDLRWIAMGDYERLQSARAVRAEYEAQQKAILEQRKAQQEALRRQQEEYANIRRSIAGTLQGYQDQINLVGQSTIVTELYRMARQGANQAELKAAANLMSQRDALTQQNDLLNRAQGLMKENLSPQQKYAAGMRELNAMLRVAGRDFYPAYLKEAKKLRDEFQQNEVMKITAEFEIQGLDSVRAGTKEFYQLQRDSANFLLEAKAAKDVDEKSRQALQRRPEHGGVRSDPASEDRSLPFLERIARGVEAQANRPQPQIASIQ